MLQMCILVANMSNMQWMQLEIAHSRYLGAFGQWLSWLVKISSLSSNGQNTSFRNCRISIALALLLQILDRVLFFGHEYKNITNILPYWKRSCYKAWLYFRYIPPSSHISLIVNRTVEKSAALCPVETVGRLYLYDIDYYYLLHSTTEHLSWLCR